MNLANVMKVAAAAALMGGALSVSAQKVRN